MDTEAVRRAWPDVLAKVSEIRKVSWSLVSVHCTVLEFDGQVLRLGVSTPGLLQQFQQRHHGEVVRQALAETLGLQAQVEAVAQGGGNGGQAAPPSPPSYPGPQRAAEPVTEPVSGPVTEPVTPAHREEDPPEPPPTWEPPAEEVPTTWSPPVEEPPEPRAAEPRRVRGAAGAEPEQAAPTAPSRPAEPSHDDEDLDTSATVGQPVVESVLGGTVIAVDEGPGH
ncbi:hypothetical protein [Ornithinicoccus halotolerans]|uniref:hypothetical protein n=1 Tax=Ornithinicoccus halotolerans TaxID=1748220 RepID=UPI0012961009|nr:hypothetical protein [Ornithinicoccus halotolerans]